MEATIWNWFIITFGGIAVGIAGYEYMIWKDRKTEKPVKRNYVGTYNETVDSQKELHRLLDYWTYQRKICQSVEDLANVDRKRRAILKQLSIVNTRS